MERYIVIYICGHGLKASPIMDNYDEALKFVTSDEGAGENKAIMVKIENICFAQFSEKDISIEDHT